MRITKTGLMITVAALALAGCKKEEAAPAPAATEASTAAPAADASAPAADASAAASGASTAAPDNNTNPIKP